MYEFAIIWDWLAFAVRWLHVITGIAWIGSSFYFVALDLGLKKVPHLPPGAYGEDQAWTTLFRALPYVVTLVVVAGVVGRSIPPAADGRPYVKQ